LVFASNLFLTLMVITLPFYVLLTKFKNESGKVALIIISLIFYSYWLPVYLPILLLSIIFNFMIVKNLKKLKKYTNEKNIIIFGIAINLLLLGYFKYFGFFLESISLATGWDGPIYKLALPLGISFFTFQQIAFLISFYRKEIKNINFLNYLLFVSFFPQLIAGPIVSHKEFFPQIERIKKWSIKSPHFNLGFFLFSLGLFKKSVLIDPYTSYIDILYDHAASGNILSTLDAWTAAFGYSFQIYFDFSGYSDMALGLALIFGIRLPFNFFSPYKSRSVQEFWRRWHITLSLFLRNYLYIPLGGNRYGLFQTLFALILTMVLGGLWHGAGWTFVTWGIYHGLLLIVYQLWIKSTKPIRMVLLIKEIKLYQIFSIVFTFVFISIGWVFFRSPDLETAFRIILGMIGFGPTQSLTSVTKGILLAFPLYFFIIWVMPNSMQIMAKYKVTSSKEKFRENVMNRFQKKFQFRLTPLWALLSLTLFVTAWLSLSSLSPFIYFQF